MPEYKSPPFLITIINTLPVSSVCLLLGVYVTARKAISGMSLQASDHPHLVISASSLYVTPRSAGSCGEGQRGAQQGPPAPPLLPPGASLAPSLGRGILVLPEAEGPVGGDTRATVLRGLMLAPVIPQQGWCPLSPHSENKSVLYREAEARIRCFT